MEQSGDFKSYSCLLLKSPPPPKKKKKEPQLGRVQELLRVISFIQKMYHDNALKLRVGYEQTYKVEEYGNVCSVGAGGDQRRAEENHH